MSLGVSDRERRRDADRESGTPHKIFAGLGWCRECMVHCPDCQTSLETADDIDFVEVDATTGFIKASKRFYTANCAACGVTIGSGVAGAKSNGGAA
ncbi:hypothetical protein C444_00145 [Haloarcula japonica DSM 6131]|uniref:Uncharacterized protein n=2 Tax=Haloarcula japonica TaxID=29282 RepID=M0LN65_HALJT|nr:hypothetical protein C444_00145 [Haloarcula japonica DSM 6131]